MLAMEEPIEKQHNNIARIATNLKILRQRLYDDIQLRALLEDSIETLSLINEEGSDRSSKLQEVAHQYQLTNRELQVLDLLLSGQRPQIISKQLSIALNTVRRHLSAIFRKLKVKSQVECIEKFGV